MTLRAARAHSDTIARIRLLADVIPSRAVAHAFVASLGSRQLEYRSALGSYAFARVLPDHPLVQEPDTYATICSSCGWSQMPEGEEEPVEHMLSERRKFGGVRHLDPEYVALDLDLFRSLPPCDASPADWETLRLILRTPALLSPAAKAKDFESAIKTILRSNKNERDMLLQILAIAGIIETATHRGFFDGYIPPQRRELPPYRFVDRGYPLIWWRAEDGVRADAVSFWFPELEGFRNGS